MYDDLYISDAQIINFFLQNGSQGRRKCFQCVPNDFGLLEYTEDRV